MSSPFFEESQHDEPFSSVAEVRFLSRKTPRFGWLLPWISKEADRIPIRKEYTDLAKAVLGIVRRNEQIRHSEVDPVTGLPNRVVFKRDLEAAVERAQTGEESLLLAVFDCKKVKRINDSYTPPKGDEYLLYTATGLRGVLRPLDKAYRIGGDEFAVIVPGFTVQENQTENEALKNVEARFEESVDLTLAVNNFPDSSNTGIYAVSGLLTNNETADAFYKRVSAGISSTKQIEKSQIS